MRSASEDPRDPIDEPFLVRRVADIEPRAEDAHWLVKPLWSAQGVGFVAGLAKSLKTWLAAEIGLAVASAGKALGCFSAEASGPVLIFTAEDELPDMRARFDGIAAARGVGLSDLPLAHIEVPELRLDDPRHMRRLKKTIEQHSPRLLILDPFVRLVGCTDENSASDVSAVLGQLRTIQREHQVAVLIVHHMRKTPAAHPGQQLRGSGDFSAWLDSGLYLTRQADHFLVTIEHRRALAPPPLRIRLHSSPPHLVVLPSSPNAPDADPSADPLRSAILAHLRASSERLRPTAEIQKVLRVRKSSLLATLQTLRTEGLLERSRDGWRLISKEARP